jgi:serine/threonine protein kinase/Tfp pilus assembly protein PilF
MSPPKEPDSPAPSGAADAPSIERRALEIFPSLVELPATDLAREIERLRLQDAALAAALERLVAFDERETGPLERAREQFDEVVERFAQEPIGPRPPYEALGPWHLLERLGSGGMGDVWLAERRKDEFAQVAAVKVIRAGMASAPVVRRFEIERRALARLQHPGIAVLLDGGVAPDGRPWFAMERVDGLPITEFANQRSLSIEGRLRLVLRACDAVEAAHRALVVHRDLKPSNILVTRGGDPKLLDFGLAKILAPEDETDPPAAARTELLAMTPAYAAPEQMRGGPITTQTDVYALGVVLYELLCGELPHARRGGSVEELSESVRREITERPSQRVAQRARDAEEGPGSIAPMRSRAWARRLAGDLDVIVLEALQAEPSRRYASVAALAEDLRRFLDGRPVRARPDTFGYRARKFLRRHSAATVGVAAAVLLLVGGVVATSWQAEKARREARRAERVRDALAGLFEQSSPEASGKRDPPASEILETGAERVDRELAASEPEVAAELLSTIAEALVQLGRLDAAITRASRAVELAESLADPPARILSLALRARSDAQAELRRYDEAEAGMRQALAATLREYGPEHLETARAERGLAFVFDMSGHVDQALPLDEHALKVFRRELPEGDPRIADQLTNLGATYDWLDRTEDAVRSYREALGIFERRLGADHPKVAGTLVNYGVALAWADRRDEALPVIERAIRIRRAKLPPNHPWIAFALNQYSVVLSQLERLDEATAASKEALAMQRANDPNHPDIPSSLNSIAVDELARGDAAEAGRLLDEALEMSLRMGWQDDPRRWQWLANSGRVLMELGRLDAAEPRLRESLDRRTRDGGENSDLARSLSPWGTWLRLSGRLDEAIAAHRRSQQLVADGLSPEHALAMGARLELAQDLMARRGAGDLAEADRESRAVLARWIEEGPADRRRILDAELVVARIELLRGDLSGGLGRLTSLLPRQVARRGATALQGLETEIYLAQAQGASRVGDLVARYAAERGEHHPAVERVRAELAAMAGSAS